MDLYDTFTVDGVRRTADGYLAAFARVARTGIQEYRGAELGKPELDRVRVYRPESEVFNSDALRSFAHRPVTLRHPTQPVTARNWKKHAGGQTGDEVVRDGEYIRVPMVMMDQALIDAYERDGVRELSMGYSTDIKWVAGVTDAGEEYDAVQTSIRGNHLAVVPLARGGDQLRIGDDKDALGHGSNKRGDQTEHTAGGDNHSGQKSPDSVLREEIKKARELYGAGSAKYRTLKAKLAKLGDSSVDDGGDCPECGAKMEGSTCPQCGYNSTQTKDGDTNMTKLVLDGLTVTVADDQSGAIIEKHIRSLNDQIKTLTDGFEDFKKKKNADDKELEEKKKMVDAKDGEIAVLKKQVADAAVTPEKLDVMVKARAAVIDKAKGLVDAKYVFDGKSVEQVRKDAVLAKLGDDAKDMNDGAIEGAFAALTAGVKSNDSAAQLGDALAHRPHGGVHVVDAREEALAARDKGISDAWKTSSAA